MESTIGKKSSIHATLALSLAALAVVVVLAGGGTKVSAANYTVDTTDDDASPARSACTGAPNDCSLRGAMIKVNSVVVDSDIITIPDLNGPGPDVFTLSITGAENAITPELTGDLDFRNAITTINGAGNGTTIISGAYMHRVFEVHIGKNVTINDVMIRHGAPVGTGPLGQPLPLQGGGITSAQTSTVTLNNVVVAENQGNDGGGIWNGGTMNVNNSTVRDNVGFSNGGGAFNGQTNTTLNINGSVFHGNLAGGAGGGAIYNDNVANVWNTTISNNTATASGGGGGGILNYTSTDMNLVNVTLAENSSSSADKGGGIRNFGALKITNSLIAGNSGGGGNCAPAGPFSQVHPTSLGDNISTDASCPFTNPGNGDLMNAPAPLGPLQNNGGPTATRALLDGNWAKDNETHGNNCFPTDQRGVARPSGPACDVGAYEYSAGPVTTPTPTPGPTPVPTPSPVPTPTLPPDAFGNVDCMDGISSVDALKVLRASAGLGYTQYEPPPCANIGTEMTVWNELQGDVDCTDVANSVDALKLLRHSAGLSVAQTEPCPNIGS